MSYSIDPSADYYRVPDIGANAISNISEDTRRDWMHSAPPNIVLTGKFGKIIYIYEAIFRPQDYVSNRVHRLTLSTRRLARFRGSTFEYE